MKAYQNFIRELKELDTFHKSTLYAYDETEGLLYFWRKNKWKFGEENPLGHQVEKPVLFGTKRSKKIQRRKNLNEIVFVRLISALEVFLVDLVRDAFLETKEPFKKQDLVFQLSQAEILSIKSPANFYNKVINRECRRLSSSGFNEIVKYYKKNFKIDLAGFMPGKSKMEEYHERRHLLVHRLGRTDIQYRDKYNTTKLVVSIDDTYFSECIEDLTTFSEMVFNQMVYQLKTFTENETRKTKEIERKIALKVSFNEKNQEVECFQNDYEFWSQDEFSVFADILDSKVIIDENTIEFNLSGTLAQIRSYTRIIRRTLRKENITAEITKEKIRNQNVMQTRILDEELLIKIKEKLPPQPWETGIHKKIAFELEVSNKLVSIAIQQLIAKGIFKQQIDGEIIEEEKTEPNNV